MLPHRAVSAYIFEAYSQQEIEYAGFYIFIFCSCEKF